MSVVVNTIIHRQQWSDPQSGSPPPNAVTDSIDFSTMHWYDIIGIVVAVLVVVAVAVCVVFRARHRSSPPNEEAFEMPDRNLPELGRVTPELGIARVQHLERVAFPPVTISSGSRTRQPSSSSGATNISTRNARSTIPTAQGLPPGNEPNGVPHLLLSNLSAVDIPGTQLVTLEELLERRGESSRSIRNASGSTSSQGASSLPLPPAAHTPPVPCKDRSASMF